MTVYSTFDVAIIVSLWIGCAIAGRVWGAIIGDKLISLFTKRG